MVERLPLVVPCEEKTSAVNELEAVDLAGQVEVLDRSYDAIVMLEATSDFFDLDTVTASNRPSAGTFYSYNEVTETVSQVLCVELGRQSMLEEPIKDKET